MIEDYSEIRGEIKDKLEKMGMFWEFYPNGYVPDEDCARFLRSKKKKFDFKSVSLPEIPECLKVHDKIYDQFVDSYLTNIENFTKEELAKIVKEIVLSGDVETKIYVSHKEPLKEGRAVYYIPFREKQKLEKRIEELENILENFQYESLDEREL